MAAVFKGLGFQVVEGVDLDKAAFDRKIRDFATTLQGAELGVFCGLPGHEWDWSGHEPLSGVASANGAAPRSFLDCLMTAPDVAKYA